MRKILPQNLEDGRIREGSDASNPSWGAYGKFIIHGPCGLKLCIVASEGEEWRPIEGYEHLYEVSNCGRVKSLAKTVSLPNGGKRHQEEVILALEIMVKGYHRVTLCRGHREMDKRLVHVLVAKAFIPNEKQFPEVNHRDGNKANNTAGNLEWCTRAYNRWHAMELGLIDQEWHGEIPEGPARCPSIHESWEHVSVSTPRRVPNWLEMCFVKDLFWEPEECVVQFHPPQSEYINNHPNVLHLWRSKTQLFPMPPSILVGYKDLSCEEAKSMNKILVP